MDASLNLGLLHFLNEIPDPRSRNGRQHPLSAVLALACCAILCGARSYAAIGQWAHDHDIELMHRLGFTRRPPKSGGIRKVLMAVEGRCPSRRALHQAGHLLTAISPDSDHGGSPPGRWRRCGISYLS